jgi:mono/diheme cytochrome c family protein
MDTTMALEGRVPKGLHPRASHTYNPAAGDFMKIRKPGVFEYAFLAAAILAPSLYAQGPAASTGGGSRASGGDQQNALVAQGKARFSAYKCYDCHGQNGEGTPDAPDLTHSRLTVEQVSKFLLKPSVDAQNKGMPDIPLDSPDHRPLVAYVMSLRSTGNRRAAAPAPSPSKAATPTGNAGHPAARGQQSALIAQGKARFKAYQCTDCHGENGEGTPDAPDLTHARLTAEQVSKFLQKPSVDAQNKGMPDIPADNPDHQPLVAYVMSLRAK